MNTSSSMRKMPSRNEFPSRKEFTVLPKDAGLPEESEESPPPVQNNVKDGDPQDESWSRLQVVGAVLKYCIQFGVAVTVLCFQFQNRPQEPHVYKTDNPWDTSRGGETYTCGCSLPASLGLGADHEDLTGNTGINICQEKSSLDTVTILTYSNSAAAKIERIFAEVEPDKLKFENISNLAVPGYNVTQEAYDLHGYINNRGIYPAVATDLQPFLRGAYPQPNTYLKLDDLLDLTPDLLTRSVMRFSMSHVRLSFQYYCNSCASCGPDVVNNVWNNISNKNDWWASCFRWNINMTQQEGKVESQTCQGAEAYYGKCLVYPTETLPPNIAITKFLNKTLFLPGINGSLDVWVRETQYPNWTALEPSHLYLNISQVQSTSIQLKFVEVIRNSPLWVSLLSLFPTLDNQCATMDRVQVCNGTSVCSLFANTNFYDISCLDMNNTSQCKQLMTADGSKISTVDNTGRSNLWSRLNASSWLELECPEFKCESVDPYLVTWDTSPEIKNDALNQFLSRWILNDSWAQRSGVCTTTYRNVYRVASGADDNVNGTMFLEANCSSNTSTSRKNRNGYCWLTRRYHNITDSPKDDWKEIGPNDTRFANKLFICYKVKREGFGSWFIATMGILFGWIGTVDLILRWLAKRIQPWIRKKTN